MRRQAPAARRGTLALALLAAPLLAALPETSCHPHQEAFVTDESGRALVLHGTNMSSASKSDPLRVPSWADRDDILRLSGDWGFNIVRYLILWDALEPEPGRIDGDYLDRIEVYLDWLAEAGVHVVIDMHQDVYSRAFCCDGAPEWAIRDDGLPFERQALWFANYFQPAVMRAWDNFWDISQDQSDLPLGHLQHHFSAAWSALAARFADHPAVLGYDILNEPFPGSAFDVVNLPTGNMPAFERDHYGPFLQRVIDAIRSADADSWIFFEPTYGIPAAGYTSYLPALVDPRPGDPRLVYFPHLYSVSLEAGGGYQQGDRTITRWEGSRGEERLRHRAPLLIGEFGVTDAVPDGLRWLQDVVDMADRTTSGWTVWDYQPVSGGYSFIDSDKQEKSDKLDVLMRVYPRAVAGRPLWYRYQAQTRRFAMAFEERDGVSGITEIAVPQDRHYPGGFEVYCTDPEGTWSSRWDPASEVLYVETNPARRVHYLWIVPSDGV